MSRYLKALFILTLLNPVLPTAEEAPLSLQVTLHKLSPTGVGEKIGEVSLIASEFGTIVAPNLNSLPPGAHGLHLHENGSCEPGIKNGKPVPGLAAGGHYDPKKTGHHLGPYQDGHLGDLPVIFANSNGESSTPVLAPRITLKDFEGRSIMLHVGGDNYSDTQMMLGGGGGRFASGVVK